MMQTLPVLVLLVLGPWVPPQAASAPRPAEAGDARRTAWLDRFAEVRQGPAQTERIVQTFKVGAGGALDLANVSGDVRITGGGGNEITVEATKRVHHRDGNEARRLLQQLRVDVTVAGGRVEVRTVYPRRTGSGWDRSVSARVDYVVSVPDHAAVSVRTISGNALVTGVGGEVRAETVSGDVTVSGTANLAVARTVSGSVRVRDVAATTSLSLGTVSGMLVADGLKARTLDCGSVSGDIHLTALSVERLLARSVSGDIEFGAALVRGGRYDFSAHSGDIRLVLASDTGFEVDASTFSGSVRSDFPVTLRSRGDRTGDRRERSRAIRGSFGDGSALLSVKTFSGSVVITRK